MILTVPIDEVLYPTLGRGVCAFIETHLVHGPGDLRGAAARLDDEKRALIYRMYEVFPRKHPQAGRRRFKRVAVSLRKGSAKTEFAAWIAACELHPEGPVRCTGWTKKGEPIGGPVTDPYIPLVSYTEEQTEELAYGALKAILELSDIAGDFDIGIERIIRKGGDGKAVALASSPDSRDGARTTFQHMDETHRWVLPRLHRAHQSMLANVPKRFIADAWSLETTTAPEPGTGSVAEATMDYARAVESGKVKDSRLFFFHRQGSDEHDLTTEEGVRAAVIEASGPVAEWSDLESIVEQWRDPTTDRAYFERVWLNRLVQSSTQAFNVERWKALTRSTNPVNPRDQIVVGFDGSVSHDSTAIVATHLVTGYQWLAGLWERPHSVQDWQVPTGEVNAVICGLFAKYRVWRLCADPWYWKPWISAWSGEFGMEQVIEWPTNNRRPMAAALNSFDTAIKQGVISHDGNSDLTRHIANARRQEILTDLDEQGKPLWLIRKERPDSPHKIDAAMAAVLSWRARTDAIAKGAIEPDSVYLTRGVRSLAHYL